MHGVHYTRHLVGEISLSNVFHRIACIYRICFCSLNSVFRSSKKETHQRDDLSKKISVICATGRNRACSRKFLSERR